MKSRLHLTAAIWLATVAVAFLAGYLAGGVKKTAALAIDPMTLELDELLREKAVANEALSARLRLARRDGDLAEVKRVEEETLAVIKDYKVRSETIYKKHGKTPPWSAADHHQFQP